MSKEHGYSRERLNPYPVSPETPFAAPTPLIRASNRETDETYRGVVAVLNEKLRVVAGSCGLQWVIQKRKNLASWASFAFCATKEGLLLRLSKDSRDCSPQAWARIQALPDFFPKRGLAEAYSGLSKSGSFIVEIQ